MPRFRDGCSTVVLLGFTCPAITVATVTQYAVLRALDRVRERALARRPDTVVLRFFW